MDDLQRAWAILRQRLDARAREIPYPTWGNPLRGCTESCSVGRLAGLGSIATQGSGSGEDEGGGSERGGLPTLRGLAEIERLRANLSRILWAVESRRYQLEGLRAFVRQQCADALRLEDDASEAAAIEAGAPREPASKPPNDRLAAVWRVARRR